MKPTRLLLSFSLFVCLAGVAYVAQRVEPAGVKMADAADKLLAGLSAEQKGKATFAFDAPERVNWHFFPLQDKNRKSTRKGVSLEEMTAEQKELALSLLRAGTSVTGYTKAATVMSLEAIVRDLEKGGGAMVRNPEWYFFAVFGKPSKTEKWGWRVEGHHLSLNFVIDNGKVVASTPAFFGANPATVRDGPRKGLRTLAESEDLARELCKDLDEEQKKLAYRDKTFPEIEQAKARHNLGEPQGLPAARMTEKQRGRLMQLVRDYAARLPEDVAKVELDQIQEAGFDKVYFIYAGGLEPGKPHTYRIQGPTFVVEFLNIQPDSANNPANHIHTVWRNTKGDFGIQAGK